MLRIGSQTSICAAGLLFLALCYHLVLPKQGLTLQMQERPSR